MATKDDRKKNRIDISPIFNDAKYQWNTVFSRLTGKKLIIVTEYSWKIHNMLKIDANFENCRRILFDNFVREYNENATALHTKYDNWLFVFGNRELKEFEGFLKVIEKEILVQKKQPKKSSSINLMVVPRQNPFFEHQLNILSAANNKQFWKLHPVEFLSPYDSDVISLEVQNVFSAFHKKGDESDLFAIATSLLKLEKFYGFFPRFYGKGDAAVRVHQMLTQLEKEYVETSEEFEQNSNSNEPERFLSGNQSFFDGIILLDRDVDVVSPLVTSLNYEGLISSILNMTDTSLSLPINVMESVFGNSSSNNGPGTNAGPEGPEKITLVLNSDDEVFADLRDKHFNAIGSLLMNNTKQLGQYIGERSNDMSVEEMRKYVTRIPTIMGLKESVSNHMKIAGLIKKVTETDQFINEISLEQEFLMNYESSSSSSLIEQMIGTQTHSMLSVLRLMCLQSVTNDSLRSKVYDHYSWLIFQCYGLCGMHALIQLESVGLFTCQNPKARSYIPLKKALKLIVENGNDLKPTDINYLHGCYAPISIRIVEQMIQDYCNDDDSTYKPKKTDFFGHGPSLNVDSIFLNAVPQPTENLSFGTGGSTLQILPKNGRCHDDDNDNDKDRLHNFLVVFIGGCTHAEVAALRFLSHQKLRPKFNFLVMTTEMLNSRTFLQSVIGKENLIV